MTTKDISKTTGVTRQAIAELLRNGRKDLREILKEGHRYGKVIA